jgi:hypothetical protein
MKKTNYFFDLQIKFYNSKTNIKTEINLISLLKKSINLNLLTKYGFKNSKILTNDSQIKTLIEDFKLPKKIWKKIYCATEHGFKVKDFHETCDYKKPPTFIIIKSEHGNIFGGLTNLTWDSSNLYFSNTSEISDWLYVLNGKNPQKILPKSSYGEIYCGKTYGISFGGTDIRIFDDSNINLKSYSGLGNTYMPESFKKKEKYDEKELFSLLAGSESFKTVEIEVFN